MQGDEFDKVFNKEKLKITLAQEKIPNEKCGEKLL